MGLDMYLEAELYTSDYSNKEINTKIADAIPEINSKRVTFSFRIGYWRKANQIHKWFVDNVQGGTDNCERHEVSTEKLTKLQDICRKVLEGSKLVPGSVVNGYISKSGGPFEPNMEDGKIVEDPSVALELLPPGEGFFFGGTYIDQWYVQDIESTMSIIGKCLSLGDQWEFYYRSSW
jgi:hypothetical protein